MNSFYYEIHSCSDNKLALSGHSNLVQTMHVKTCTQPQMFYF